MNPEATFKELHETDVTAAVVAMFPDAQISADDDGRVIINTGCMWSGKNGDQILGHMTIEGVDLSQITELQAKGPT